MVRLFAWMRSQFGAKWTIEATPESLRSWHALISRYTLGDLRRACRMVVREGGKYPPSGTEFAKLCRGSVYDQRKRAERWAPPLPPPPKDVTRNSRRVAELRERLKLPRSEQVERELEERRRRVESDTEAT